jgi:hypothetical protein
LSAYRYAEFIGLPDFSEAPMPEVDKCLALVIRPSSYDLIPVRVDEDTFRDFLYVQQVREFAENKSKRILGKKLVPPVDHGEPRPYMAPNVEAMVD